jgi:hypothetical protein
MAYVLVFVLDNVDDSSRVLSAWDAAGAPGITILDSLGVGRVRSALRDDIPLLPSLDDLFQRDELRHRTLFTVVDDEAILERLIEATKKIVGDFDQPHSGFLFVLPVLRALGLGRKRSHPHS